MLNTFIISFKLRTAYKTNGIIYGLKSLPILKKILPNSLYAVQDIKTVVNIISLLVELSTIFLGKGIYIALIYWAAISLNAPQADSFVHIIMLLTIVGGILNTHIFNPTKDKYYAICLMRMDSRKYAISNYIYYFIKTFIGFLVLSIIFGLISGVGIIACISVPIFVISIKPCYSAWVLKRCKREKTTKNENKITPIQWIIVAMLLIIAFLPPYLGYAINERFFVILTALMILPGAFSLKYILQFDEYRRIYKELLKLENIYMNTSKTATSEVQMLAMQKKNIH